MYDGNIYLGCAARIVDGTGEEKLPLSIDYQRPSVVRYSLRRRSTAGEFKKRTHNKNQTQPEDQTTHLHLFFSFSSSLMFLLLITVRTCV
uniref:Uncharacterized protein n=1 Tax=Arabidopsis thaliana TaxID=3702 RepID=Q56YD9_ARATH|nr:hypothetical protein [Arabidopsis thaliana]